MNFKIKNGSGNIQSHLLNTMTDIYQQYIGKRVRVKIPERDNRGKVIPNKYVWGGGICDYLGPNRFLKIPLIAVVSRLPITLNSLDDIIIVEEKKVLIKD